MNWGKDIQAKILMHSKLVIGNFKYLVRFSIYSSGQDSLQILLYIDYLFFLEPCSDEKSEHILSIKVCSL